jgi:hypothetical protein
MHYITLCTTYITLLLVSHTCIFTIDPTEQEPDEPQEPAQAEYTNLEQEQCKLRFLISEPAQAEDTKLKQEHFFLGEVALSIAVDDFVKGYYIWTT